ncbi:hypothetical protein C8F04DRAFT_1094385 [Mycena alexandri]|uniref:Uncharacterized protein n=1 Tax=Mycena alexandri TaxID=1745969 RepID=A0AAD6T0B6_9AGAR|nr:hypothetical protein C8F04DRAFT_1094385 [Mycena alexandri]
MGPQPVGSKQNKTKIKLKALKQYKIPKDKHFIFVKNPWPFHSSIFTARNETGHINNIVGWICVMVNDLCDTATAIGPVDVIIYSQSTHRDLIAEIEVPSSSGEFKLDPLLGAHHSLNFLRDQPEGVDVGTSVIFEYDYTRCNAPGSVNWTSFTASYTDLHINFPIKHEGRDGGTFAYPSPGPTDTKRPQWAKPLPGHLILGNPGRAPPLPAPPAPQAPNAAQPPHPQPPQHESAARLTAPQREPSTQPASVPIENSRLQSSPASPARSKLPFEPYERLRVTATKRDPYEEEQAACAQLRGPAEAAPVLQEAIVKSEPNVKQEAIVKQEEDVVSPAGRELVTRALAKMHAHNTQSSAEGGSSIMPPQRVEDEGDVGNTEPAVKMEVDVDSSGIKREEAGLSPEEERLGEQAIAALSARNRNAGQVDVLKPEQERNKAIQPEGIRVKREPMDSDIPRPVPNIPPPPSIKPEPMDAPIPKLPPPHKRFDPFAGFEPDLKPVVVKREEENCKISLLFIIWFSFYTNYEQ